MTSKAVAGRGSTRKSVSSTAWRGVHGMKAAVRCATGMKAAAVKTSSGSHAAAMEAASARMKASAAVEATAASMEAAATTVESASAACMEAAATTVESAASATMKAATTAASVGAASTAAAPWSRLRRVGQHEACNSTREHCGNEQRNLSAGNSHGVLHLAEGRVGKTGNATHYF